MEATQDPDAPTGHGRRAGAPPSPGTPRRRPAATVGAVLSRLRTPIVGALTVAGLVALVAALPWLRDDDPARAVLRARFAEREADPAALESIRRELDIPDGPVRGAAQWLARAVRGDLGVSWVDDSPVASTVVGALGVSITLSLFACLVAVATALLLTLPGLWRAARTGGGTGRRTVAAAALLASVPEFLLAAVLLAVVAVRWRWFPTSGWAGPEYAILPALALGLPAGGLLARILAQAMDTILAESWTRTWRACGYATWRLVAAVARRAGAVTFPLLVLLFVGLLGAAVVVESVFAIRGLGATALDAVLAQDLPLVQGSVAALVVVGLLVGGGGIAVHRLLVGPALSGSGLSLTVETRPAGGARLPLALAAVLLAVVVVGLTRDPGAVVLDGRLATPSLAHPLGADALGRDVLARLGHGALLSIGTALVVSAIALCVGLLLGLAGERARAGGADVLNALPPVLVGVVVAAIAGPGLVSAAVAVCLVAWVPLAVHARTLATEIRATGFVQAARAGGAGRLWILRTHLLPLVLPAVTRHALVRLPHNALALASLSFIGLGAPHDSPEWGAMLAESIAYVERAPWTVAAPAAGLALLGVIAALARPGRG